ncbi:hypothetical protein GCM10023194_73330 [Planotetraspora phitsanulokensis]|uniref:Aminoglycoside phosphotransferase domain-containing protein n=1 Tax=Planotetraspora phitsanulokensis TaxID=575192 RepID=A0A8J3U259_9ACTN|nr:hypothetical protein [Planotetraspora phitsanulokensis]GII37168.1 hypothetical protein Pph01_21710 [Planotetraspora phitsanulokensis]
MRDTPTRLRYLHQVLAELYPPGTSRGSRTLLPHRLVPRRLVPRTRWHAALGRGVPVWDGPDTIETHLSQVLGRRIRAVVHVRPARRANRKPVLEAHDEDGLIAFVKIGDSDRARELVRHEGEVLRMLADHPMKVVVPPSVVHQGTWRGLEVLVVSALPVTAAPVPRGLRDAAVAEIASFGRRRTATHGPLPGEPAWPRSQAVSARMSGTPLHDHAGWGWHGDFAPWNLSAAPDGRLLVWDWERFATGVPLGFDALHYYFNRALRRMRPAVAARSCLAQAGLLLEPFGLSSAEARRSAAHYLITLADRHHRDGHEPLGPSSLWLNPLVDHLESLL